MIFDEFVYVLNKPYFSVLLFQKNLLAFSIPLLSLLSSKADTPSAWLSTLCCRPVAAGSKYDWSILMLCVRPMSLDSSSLVSSGAMMSSVDDAESLEILRLLGECDAIYTQKEIWSKKLIH